MLRVPRRVTNSSLLAGLCLVFLAGCQSLQQSGPAQPTAEEQLVANLRKSVELLRGSLKTTVRERDNLKQDFVSSQEELRTARGDVEYLEAKVRLYRTRVADLESDATQQGQRLHQQDSELEQQQTVARSHQETIARLRQRLQKSEDERQKVGREIIVAEQRVEATQGELERLQREVASNAEIVAQAKLDQSDLVRQQAQSIRNLNEEVAALKANLVASESIVSEAKATKEGHAAALAKVEEAARNAKLKADKALAEAKAATPESAVAYFGSWSRQAVADIQAGEINNDAKAFIGVAAAILLALILLLAFWLRGSSAKKRNRRLDEQLQSALAMTSRDGTMLRRAGAMARTESVGAKTVAAAAAQGSTAHLDATVQMPKVVPAQPPGAAVGSPAPQDATPEKSISQSLDQALTESDGAPRQRQVIGAATRDGGKAGVAKPGDEELLKDLKSVIREKFSDM